MRKFCLVAVCAALLFFVGCSVSEPSTLPELTRPYAAVYECEELTLGGEDCLETIRCRIKLSPDETFVLSWQTETGAEGEQTGRYAADVGREEIVFFVQRGGRELSHAFPFKGGAIFVDVNLGGRLLHAVFRMP